MKKLRNLIIVVGVMTALLPSFLYYSQDIFYGTGFSLITTCLTTFCFFAASIIQYFDYKKKNYPTNGPLIAAAGFIILTIYLLTRYL